MPFFMYALNSFKSEFLSRAYNAKSHSFMHAVLYFDEMNEFH